MKEEYGIFKLFEFVVRVLFKTLIALCIIFTLYIIYKNIRNRVYNINKLDEDYKPMKTKVKLQQLNLTTKYYK